MASVAANTSDGSRNEVTNNVSFPDIDFSIHAEISSTTRFLTLKKVNLFSTASKDSGVAKIMLKIDL